MGSRRSVVLAVVLTAMTLLAPAAARADDCAGADIVPAAENLAQVTQSTLCLINQQRAARGLQPLTEQRQLTSASTSYSQRMVDQRFFAHESPDGVGIVARLEAVGYVGGDEGWAVGENIGWGQGPLSTPRAMVTAWMNSAGHRTNILDHEFVHIGLGLAMGTPPDASWGATYTTDFGVLDTQPEPVAATARSAAKRPVRAASRSLCARQAAVRKHARGRTCARPARAARR
jgi:uncharacterized protein YkwD